MPEKLGQRQRGMSRCEKGWGPDLGRVFKCFYKGKQGQAWNGVIPGGSVVEETPEQS